MPESAQALNDVCVIRAVSPPSQSGVNAGSLPCRSVMQGAIDFHRRIANGPVRR